MKISVVVPVYNCEPYVERCIRSIMTQTYTNIEIICVNDGSTDNSGKILDNLACEDARIQVVHQANAGVSTARNVGIDLATGDILAFVDSDDALESDMYETLLSYFEDETVDIVHCGYKRICLDGSVKNVNGTEIMVRQNKYEAAECLLSGRLFVGSLWNKLYRAYLFRDVRMNPSLAINEDVLANAELFTKANVLVYLDVGKYLMFERQGSATSGTRQCKILSDCAVAAEKILEIYKGTPAEQAATDRVLNSQISLYRWYVMNSFSTSRQKRKDLADKIVLALKKRESISARQRMNFALLRFFPILYKLSYSIYDKVRVPNWDVD